MKKIRLLFVLLIVCVLVLSACNPDNPFFNPGDKLGGGGIGDVSDPVDNSQAESVKDAVVSESDLGDLADKTSDADATRVEPTEDVVEITSGGVYYFSGAYGGIHIGAAKLDLRFVFDNVTIARQNGVAIDGTDVKNTSLIITVKDGTTNTVSNSGTVTNKKGEDETVNAIHVKGALSINGSGTLNVISASKSALKASKQIQIVNATLNLEAINHAITGASVVARDCNINVREAGKDGINAECDGATEFRTSDGFVSLTNVNYTCNVSGDGIQADTVAYVNGGTYNITTNGEFVAKSAANMEKYGMVSDDFKYILSGGAYKRIASDETNRYGTLYGLSQSCKGIKVGEITYDDDSGNEVTVTDGDYLIAIVGGTFNINSTDDAIHTNSGNVLIEGGTYTLQTYDDAITSDVLTKITGGNITVTKCYEGIEGAYVEISGGVIDLIASDDGINAASDDRNVTEHIIISGGTITVDSGGDGIDSNGSILISGGMVTVYGPTSGGDAGLDADRGIVITGGTVFVTSTLGMVETPSTNSTQYVVSYAHQSTISAGSTVSLRDANGNSLISVTVKKNCQSIIMSSPQLKNGSKYSIYGGSTEMTNFTVSSIITTIGSSGSSFPGGGPGGPGRPGGR